MSGSIGNNPYRASGVVAALAAGRTGTVDWDTTPKTATFTATTAEGYFCNTNGGVFTVNLPAGVAGSIVSVADYTRTFNTNNLTVDPNGSEKIGGGDAGASATLSVDGQSATFVYVDGTEGWINVQETETSQTGSITKFVTATGGSPCTGSICGDYKTHSFTGPGTLAVSCAGNACGSSAVDYLVVAGGGGGGAFGTAVPGTGGGGGAGGFRESKNSCAPWTASPIASATSLTLSATPYAVTVGGAGAANTAGSGGKGGDSVFSTITSTGGGLGNNAPPFAGGPGGSGGGAGGTCSQPTAIGGSGNTPPTTPDQGTDGGDALFAAPAYGSGGGGGATEEGVDGTAPAGGRGGAGATTCISESPTAYAGGGGGGYHATGTAGAASPCSTGGAGSGSPTVGGAGTTNRGGGGGGHGGVPGVSSGAGGSGIVIIRYKFQ